MGHLRAEPGGADDAGTIGRRLLRRADRRRPGGVLVHVAAPAAALVGLRRVCARHRARARHRPVRLFLRRLLLRQGDHRAVGDHLHQRVRRAQRRHADQSPAASDPAVRSGRRAADSGLPACDRAQRAAVPGPHLLGLHAALRDLPLHHRVLPRRRPRDRRHVLDLPVRVAADRADQHRHAVILLARRPQPAPHAAAARRAA